jgi:hypothetical protein
MNTQLLCRPPDKGVTNEVSGGFNFSKTENPPALRATPLIRGAKP